MRDHNHPNIQSSQTTSQDPPMEIQKSLMWGCHLYRKVKVDFIEVSTYHKKPKKVTTYFMYFFTFTLIFYLTFFFNYWFRILLSFSSSPSFQFFLSPLSSFFSFWQVQSAWIKKRKKVHTKQNLTKHGFFGPWANKLCTQLLFLKHFSNF